MIVSSPSILVDTYSYYFLKGEFVSAFFDHIMFVICTARTFHIERVTIHRKYTTIFNHPLYMGDISNVV